MPTISAAPSPSAASTRSGPVARREGDRHEPRSDQAAQAACDQLEQARQLDLARERRPDLVQRLELLRPGRRRLVQARVLDRHRRLARERPDELLILLGERPRLLLGQVEVAEGTAAEQDRHAEEAAHRRMVGREADRARVVGDRLQPQRARVGDQGAEDAAAAREVTDLGHRLGVDPGVDEALEPSSRLVDHAERRVAGAGQLGGSLGQLQQQIVERELRAQRDAGVDEPAQAAGVGDMARLSVPEASIADLPQPHGGSPRCRVECSAGD